MSDSRLTLYCPLCGACASLNSDGPDTHPTVVWLGRHMVAEHWEAVAR